MPSAVPPALRVKTILSVTARIAPNQTLRPPVSWAPAHYRLCRCNHKAGAWKMHANRADLTITASDDDFMDARGDQLADDRVASGIIRRDGHCLTRFSADRISWIEDNAGDRRSVPRRIERFFRGRWAPPAVADCGNALGPTQKPRKAVERRHRWPEIAFQEPNRMVGGEIGKARGRALQEWALVDQHLIQPIEMRAQLIEQVRYRRHHRGRVDISAGEFGSVFEESLGQRVASLREHEASGRAERRLLGPPGKR